MGDPIDPTDGDYVNIWANSGDVPNTVCKDARLHDRDGALYQGDPEAGDADEADLYEDADGKTYRIVVYQTKTWGQQGWAKGINYHSADDLLRRLRNLKAAGRIKGVARLAIHAHGMPGKVFVNGMSKAPLTGRDLEYKAFLKELRGFFPPHGGQLLFMGCAAAQNNPSFLEHVSLDMPNVEIVAFEKIGVTSGAMVRTGPTPHCAEPGMRLSPFDDSGPGTKALHGRHYARAWNDLRALHWATPLSPYAAIAINGRIVKHARSTKIPFRMRIALNNDFAPRKGVAKSRAMPEVVNLPVELKDDEVLLFAALPNWRAVADGKAAPVPHDRIAFVSGMPRHRAEQALRGLSAKLLAMVARQQDVTGYVRLR